MIWPRLSQEQENGVRILCDKQCGVDLYLLTFTNIGCSKWCYWSLVYFHLRPDMKARDGDSGSFDILMGQIIGLVVEIFNSSFSLYIIEMIRSEMYPYNDKSSAVLLWCDVLYTGMERWQFILLWKYLCPRMNETYVLHLCILTASKSG